jgi:hypothetical protein
MIPQLYRKTGTVTSQNVWDVPVFLRRDFFSGLVKHPALLHTLYSKPTVTYHLFTNNH